MTAFDSKRILIADYDLKLQTMLGQMLTRKGYQVSHAVNGREAIALHHHAPFDLVIAELGLDGFGDLMPIRRHTSPAKFIATFKTSWLPTELCFRIGAQLGSHCVLAKPFSPELLLSAVHSALKRE
jgi:two-component system alkaline phosphatase synthesis response regulator PhoP